MVRKAKGNYSDGKIITDLFCEILNITAILRLIIQLSTLFYSFNNNQRTNGPVNAHLRSAAYTNKHV